MKKILLSNGDWTLVSDEDYIYLVGFNWSLSSHGYAVARINGRNQYMHRVIAGKMRLNLTGQIDHIDRNELNNQRSNLRIATKSQNAHNSKCFCTNMSGIKGVCFDKDTQKWRAYLEIDCERMFLGYYDDINQAAYARLAAEKQYLRS